MREPTDVPTTLHTFFWPTSIAVVGASTNVDSLSSRPLDILDQHGFGGNVCAVNPRYDRIGTVPCYPTVCDVPFPVDLALIVTNAAVVLDVVTDCVKAGVRYAIILSSGFSEAEGEEGDDRQVRLDELLQGSDLRILGPNAEGYMNVVGRIPASFSPAISYKMGLRQLLPGHLAIVAQSGGVGFGLFSNAMLRGTGISYIVTTGNETDLEIDDFVEYLLDDPDTHAIALFVEGFQNGPRFLELAGRAADRGKPLVIGKVGTSQAGRRATESHTAHLAGDRFTNESVFRHFAVVQAHDQDDLLDKASALALCPLPAGDRVAVLTLSGGAGAWVADACADVGLDLPPMSQAGQQSVRDLIGDFGSTNNPIDVTGMGVRADGLAGPLEVVLGEPQFDSVIVVTPLASSKLVKADTERLSRAIAKHGKPVLFYSYSPPHEESVAILHEMGVPWYPSPGRVAGALAALVTYARSRPLVVARAGSDRDARVGRGPVERLDAYPDGQVPEYAAKALLSRSGIPVTREALTSDVEEAEEAAASIGYPVALKLQSPQLPHKTDVGGVALDITEPAALRTTYASLGKLARSLEGISLDGILVQEMISGGHEIIVGTTVDADFGPMIVVGMGGVYAEVLQDRVAAPVPLSPTEAARLIGSLRGFPLLQGSRGAPPADIAALADLVSSISMLADIHRDDILEIEANPVLVRKAGAGAIVVDALINAK
jgi:acyl-CoA synthetase (NDP forming)